MVYCIHDEGAEATEVNTKIRTRKEVKKMVYIIEMNVNGEWKIWQRYDEAACGISPKGRAEMGMKIARCYGECRIVEVEEV